MTRPRAPFLALTTAALMLLSLAACSSSPSAVGSSSAAESATDPEVVTAAEQQLAIDQEGLYGPPPATGPSAQAGKNVTIIPCGTAVPGCSFAAEGMEDAAAALGWSTTIIDGQVNPTGYQAAIRQAIAAKTDGIMVVSISCADIKTELQQAADAGIPVVAGPGSFDCDVEGGENLYAGILNADGSPTEFAKVAGAMQANYIIATTGGDAKIINMIHKDFTYGLLVQEAFDDVIGTCAGCEIVATVEISAADLGSPSTVQQKTSTVLQQHPDATVLRTPSDTVLSQIGQTLRQLNNPDLIVIGAEGYPDTLDLLREGYSTAAGAYSEDWAGWAAADTLNRIFAGASYDEIPDSGMNLQMIDKDHGLDPTLGAPYTPYSPAVDYKTAYKEVWGQ